MAGTNIYRFFEWAGEQDGYGAYGFAPWDRIHKGPGQYDWAFVDAWLDKQAGKPTLFAIATHLSQLDGWESFADCTPPFVYDGLGRPTMHGRPVGKIVTYTDKDGKTLSAALPYYNDQSRWWKYLQEFVMAFGARYDGRFTALAIGPGLDIENQPSKSPFGDGSQSNRFGQLCLAYSDWHKQAFVKTPVFVVVSIGQGRMILAQKAAANGQGIKHNGGFISDLDSHQGYDNFVGSWDAMQWANDFGVPTWVESAYGYQDPRSKYWWSIYASLAYHPVAVDIHSGLLDAMTPEQIDFIEAHTNVTAATAPSAWCVLRDMEYPVKTWSQKQPDGSYLPYGCSGHPGNWDFYLTMLDGADAPRYEDVGPSDAPESRQCRRVTEAMFKASDLFPPPSYILTITWLQEPGKVLSVNGTPVSNSENGLWAACSMTLDDRQFVLTGNGAAVHMLTVTPTTEPPEPPDDDIDADVILKATDLARQSVEAVTAAVDRATHAVGVASTKITEAEQALQEAVDQQDLAVEALLQTEESLEAAMAQLDTITKEASGAE